MIRTIIFVILGIAIIFLATANFIGYCLSFVFGGPGGKFIGGRSKRNFVAIPVVGLLSLLSCSTLEMQIEKDISEPRVVVKKGNHDFKPTPFYTILSRKARSFIGYAQFDSNCWYDSLGEDNYDWNKLVGVHQHGRAKNYRSLMIAWRPHIRMRDWFEICLYENDPSFPESAHFKTGTIYAIRANERLNFKFILVDNKYHVEVNTYYLGKQQSPFVFNQIGFVHGWFGGNRTAPHDMSMILNLQL